MMDNAKQHERVGHNGNEQQTNGDYKKTTGSNWAFRKFVNAATWHRCGRVEFELDGQDERM